MSNPYETTIPNLTAFATQSSDLETLPPSVVEISKEIIVNAAAVGLAGAAQQEGQVITRFVQEMGGNGRCTIIGKGLRTSPVYAALANGLMIRLLDFDDEIIPTASHQGSAIFPVVMALGEMHGIPGRDVLSAFILGCEITAKLDRTLAAAGESPGMAATVGAAAAAGRLLNLTGEQLTQALLLAGQSPTGRADLEAGPAAAYRQGQSAMHGLLAAMLAGQGLAASPGSGRDWADPGRRDSPDRPNAAAAELADCLGNPYDVISPGVSLKLYPCASPSHPVIDAVLQLLQQYRVAAEQMTDVAVGVTPAALAAMPFPTPTNGWEARNCLSFVVASALAYGHPLIDNFTDTAVSDPRVRELMDRISVTAGETPSQAIPYPASVTITLLDGRQLRHRVEFARGQPELPLSPEELDAKFLYCSRYILPPDHIEESITRLRDLENIDNTTGIFSVLGG